MKIEDERYKATEEKYEDYQSVLYRLREVRMAYGLTQKATARLLGMTQGNYSSMESGIFKLPCMTLRRLYRVGWDVDYIVTGIGRNDLEMVFDSQNFSVLPERLLHYIWWILTCSMAGNGAGEADQAAGSEMQLLQMLLYRQSSVRGMAEKAVFLKPASPLQAERELLGISQCDMAEMLGVGVKLYRKFEREIAYPDAQLLQKLYQITKCRATLFMGMGREAWRIAGHVWSGLPSGKREWILEAVKHNTACMRMLETYDG